MRVTIKKQCVGKENAIAARILLERNVKGQIGAKMYLELQYHSSSYSMKKDRMSK